MAPNDPTDAPDPVPPGKPWIETPGTDHPTEPSDPRKPWIEPNDPTTPPVRPQEPQPPFVQ
jgi:hypothetical protein